MTETWRGTACCYQHGLQSIRKLSESRPRHFRGGGTSVRDLYDEMLRYHNEKREASLVEDRRGYRVMARLVCGHRREIVASVKNIVYLSARGAASPPRRSRND